MYARTGRMIDHEQGRRPDHRGHIWYEPLGAPECEKVGLEPLKVNLEYARGAQVLVLFINKHNDSS